jgi:hypothetical protein
MSSSYFPGLVGGGYGLPADMTRPDPNRRVPRILLPFDRGITSAAGALGSASEGIRSGLDYLGESVPAEEEIPEPPAAAGGVPYYLQRPGDEPDYLGALKPPDFLRGLSSGAAATPEPPVPLEAQFQRHADDGDDYLESGRGGSVAVTIGGKTYDYGAGERIPTMFRGQFGEGNLAANQPGGVVPGREPSQISMQGLADEERRGGTGVSMMQKLDGVTMPSELEEAREGAALSRLNAIAEDPYGLKRFEGEERIRSASAREKGAQDRATQAATRSGFSGEMGLAQSRFQAAMERLRGMEGTMEPEDFENLREQLEDQFAFDKQTISGKYGVRLPTEPAF